jgi:hypothetical protein
MVPGQAVGVQSEGGLGHEARQRRLRCSVFVTQFVAAREYGAGLPCCGVADGQPPGPIRGKVANSESPSRSSAPPDRRAPRPPAEQRGGSSGEVAHLGFLEVLAVLCHGLGLFVLPVQGHEPPGVMPKATALVSASALTSLAACPLDPQRRLTGRPTNVPGCRQRGRRTSHVFTRSQGMAGRL